MIPTVKIDVTTLTDSGPVYLYDTDHIEPIYRVERVVYDTCNHCGGLNEEKELDALCEWCGRPVYK